MKKLFIIFFIVSIALSCNRELLCECSNGDVINFTDAGMNYREAKKHCNNTIFTDSVGRAIECNVK